MRLKLFIRNHKKLLVFAFLTFLFAGVVFMAPVSAQQGENIDYSPLCSLTNGIVGDGSFLGCFSYIIHFVFYQVPAWFAWLMGTLFDFFLGFSIDSDTYGGGTGEVIKRGWVIVRDISNIFFIGILLYTAIATIFNAPKVSYKAIVPHLILNALLINFSLFATKVMIDVSNVTAHVFYNQIVVKDQNGTERRSPGGYTRLSEAILAGYNPQRIIGLSLGYLTDASLFKEKVRNIRDILLNKDISDDDKNNHFFTFNQEITALEIKASAFSFMGYGGNLSINADGTFQKKEDIMGLTKEEDLEKFSNEYVKKYGKRVLKVKQGTYEYAGKFIVTSIVAGLISFFTGLMFFRVSFVFVGRVVALYIAMIFSPFAFMSRSMPMLKSEIDRMSWEKWLKIMTNQMILAPLFIFFLYIIHEFVSSDFYQGIFPPLGTGFWDTTLSVALPFVIIYSLLVAARKTTLKYADELTEKLTGGIMNLGAAALTGGIAGIGRATLGRAGAALANSKRLRAGAASDNAVARGVSRSLLRLGNYGATQTYDPRNTKAFQEGFDIKTKDTQLTNFLRLSSTNTKGGYVGAKERKVGRMKQEMKDYQLTGQAAYEFDAPARAWDERYNKALQKSLEKNPLLDVKKFKEDYDGTTAWEAKYQQALQTAKQANPSLNENTFKEQYKKTAAPAANLRPKDSKDVNRDRNNQYLARRQKGNLVTNTYPTGGAGATLGGVVGSVPGLAVVGSIIGGEAASERAAELELTKEYDKIQKINDEIKSFEKQIEKLEEFLRDPQGMANYINGQNIIAVTKARVNNQPVPTPQQVPDIGFVKDKLYGLRNKITTLAAQRDKIQETAHK